MPEPRRRRQGEPEHEDPAEISVFRKAAKNPWIDGVIRIVLVIGTAGGTGYVANEHKSAEDAINYERLTKLQADFEKFRTTYYERQRERSTVSQREREEFLQRLAVIETELRLLRGGGRTGR